VGCLLNVDLLTLDALDMRLSLTLILEDVSSLNSSWSGDAICGFCRVAKKKIELNAIPAIMKKKVDESTQLIKNAAIKFPNTWHNMNIVQKSE